MREKITNNLWWLLPVALSGILYLNSLKGGFFWDDRGVILENPAVKSWGSSLSTFRPGYWLTEHPGSKGQYRPLRNLTFTFDYSLWSNRPAGYHFTNYLLNLAAVGLICLAARELFLSETAALFSGLVFAFHPMHAETVNFIKNRSDILCLILLLASLYAFMKGRKGVSLAAYIAALFAKELAVAYPFVLLFLAGREGKGSVFKRTLPYFIPAAGLLALKLLYLKVPAGLAEANPLLAGAGPLRLVASTLTQYFYLLFFPFKLELDRRLDLLSGPASPAFLFFALFWAAVAWVLYKRRPAGAGVYLFSAAWIFLFLGPVSNLVPLAARPVAEQRLYVPSAGVAFLLGGFLAALYGGLGAYRKYAGAALAALLLFFGYMIMARNALWADEIRFWAQALRENPGRAYDNLAAGLMRAGAYSEAEKVYLQLLRRFPGNSSIYANLGVLAQAKGDVKGAIGYFTEASRLEPGSAELRMNLGSMYLLSGDRAKARALYLEAAALNPRSPGVYTNLGVLAAGEGKARQAAEYFRKAVDLDPDQIEARLNLANAYMALGLRREAEEQRREAQARLAGGAEAPKYNPSVVFKK